MYSRKWNFLAPRLKNFLYFWKWNFLVSYFSYISGKKFLSSKNKKPHSEEISYIFSKKSFSYVSGNGTFLYFLKEAFVIFPEMEFSILKNKNFQEVAFASSKNKKNHS